MLESEVFAETSVIQEAVFNRPMTSSLISQAGHHSSLPSVAVFQKWFTSPQLRQHHGKER